MKDYHVHSEKIKKGFFFSESLIEMTESEPNMDGLIIPTARTRQESTYIVSKHS